MTSAVEKLTPIVSEKICAKCGVNKPASAFRHPYLENNGFRTYCNECQKTEAFKYAILRNSGAAKKCSQYKETKELIQFGMDNNSADGSKSSCLYCNRIEGRIRSGDPEYRQIKYQKEKVKIALELKNRTHYTCNTCKGFWSQK